MNDGQQVLNINPPLLSEEEISAEASVKQAMRNLSYNMVTEREIERYSDQYIYSISTAEIMETVNIELMSPELVHMFGADFKKDVDVIQNDVNENSSEKHEEMKEDGSLGGGDDYSDYFVDEDELVDADDNNADQAARIPIMDVLDENMMRKLQKEELTNKRFAEDKLELRVVSTADATTSYEYLLKVKNLFQLMLPKMPRSYILRQVFDAKHCILVLNGQDASILGAICYRPGFGQNLIEIVFLAIDAAYHISGYGTFLFGCFKEVCKLQYENYMNDGEHYSFKNMVFKTLDIYDYSTRDPQAPGADATKENNADANENAEQPARDLNTTNNGHTISSFTDAAADLDNANGKSTGGALSTLKGVADSASISAENRQPCVRAAAMENAVSEASGNCKFSESATVKKFKLDSKSSEEYKQPGPEVTLLNPKRTRLSSSTNIYMLTYADNSAIGFFKKQGFTQWPSSSGWIGYIKDYEGGTLMEGKIHPQINYLQKGALIKAARKKMLKKMEAINDYHILRTNEERGEVLERYKTDVWLPRPSPDAFFQNFILFLICALRTDSSAWPFLEPVDVSQVPDYLSVIEHPMDLSKIMARYRNGEYTALKALSNDVYLMVNNCLTYNAPSTQYYKCGEGIRATYNKLIKKYERVLAHWGYGI